MRKHLFVISVFGTVLLTAAPVLAAPTPEELSDAQKNQIAQNCRQIQVDLRNIQKRDTVLRINRGRLYDMTLRQTGAFVARLNVNKIDAPEIGRLDSEIRAKFLDFKLDYDKYAQSRDQAVNADCAASPQEFYQALHQSAKERRVVGEDVAAIKKYLSEYVGALAALSDQKFPAGDTR